MPTRSLEKRERRSILKTKQHERTTRTGMENLSVPAVSQRQEQRRESMCSLLISLGVGLVIGILFKSLKLPVPVPHGLGGMIGLVGMFAGSELVSVFSRLAAKS